MSSLSGQTIQSTYQGLLKTANNSAVSSTPQEIQDGEGNNTGLRVATNFFTAPNQFGYNAFQPDYMGNGFPATAGQLMVPTASYANVIIAVPFYDNGKFAYSGMNYYISGTTTDTVEMAFYNSQYVPGTGLVPYEPLITGLTPSVTVTGLKTLTFPSTFSYSGTGGGIYFAVYKITSGGAPTIRWASGQNQAAIQQMGYTEFGYVINSAGTAVAQMAKSALAPQVYPSLSTFPSQFSVSDAQGVSTTLNGAVTIGFGLATVR